MQRITDINDSKKRLFEFIESTLETDEQLNDIMYDEKQNSQLFDLTQGLVFRCHIVYYKKISSNGLLSDKDVLIFNFHHVLFDFASMNVFIHDLNEAYNTGQLPITDDNAIRYLDYTVIEQQIPMTSASLFWLDALHGCKLDQFLPLPYDRYRLSGEHRTGHGMSFSFDFDQDLSSLFLSYASANNIKLQHLALATYYAFLFKLTNGERDLCIGINIADRYKEELMSVIGMFVNTIPLRCQLDPCWSFHHLVQHVSEIITNSLEHSYFPLQRILTQHPNISNPAFVDISFDFDFTENDSTENEVIIGDSQLRAISMPIKISEDKIMNKFDFVLIIYHHPNVNQLSCTINASFDLFNAKTIDKVAQRFHSMLNQLFQNTVDQVKNPVYELSLIFTDERLLVQSINNIEVLFPSVNCIHHEFVYQVIKYPQKVAVELDDQSLTYSELLHYVQLLSLHLLNIYGMIPGEIVCQCMERSLSMVIGMMAIEMAGGVYCPLSPRDPQHRLHTLLEQTQSRLLLVHHLTKTKFSDNVTSIDVDTIFTDNDGESNVDVDRLSNIIITPENIAYTIFTSGSTGTPKAAQVRHRNFTECMHSLVYIDTFNKDDTVVQMARCSFDIHVQEILGTLMIGVTLVMLHPGGTIDFDYLSEVLYIKQITYMHTVPSLLHNFFTFVKEYNNRNAVKYLRSLCSIGELFPVRLITLIVSMDMPNCAVWNLYGPAETTIVSTFHLVNSTTDTESIPIGVPLPNYQCIVLNEFSQSVIIGEEGELLVGGVGIFAGYLEREDLTKKVLIEIDGKIFYRTGDLVHMDINGLLHYHGRKDHQIKLHGQRIELGEIERCLLNTSISACVVIKWDDDHLIAYVQSSAIDEQQLREHCQSHLPPHMIPSKFIVLEKLPLNANGKIDRKYLPTPHFSVVNDTDTTDSLALTPLEEHLRCIFSQAFHTESPNVNMSFGQMGGTSLDAIRALWLIRQKICIKIDPGLLFANPSIRQLARAIEPLLVTQDKSPVKTTTLRLEDDQDRPMPNLYIEILGILLLMYQWILPIWLAYQFHSFFIVLFAPIFHLLSYVICQRVFFHFGKITNKMDKLYSWHYYRWRFLSRLWLTNNSYWLKHLLGTPFYNSYLRLCGAKIGCHTHIYTTLIDTPWLLEVGESTFIGEEVVLSSLSYQDQTYKLHGIRIGSHCSINTGCALYEDVIIEDHVYLQPMSAVTGSISASNDHTSAKNRSLSLMKTIYQFTCLLCILCMHSILLLGAYFVYHCCSILLLPLPISLALTWLIWTLTSASVPVPLLKFIVGPAMSGNYPLNSYYYLHKLWLRQLIISSFHHSLDFIPSYNILTCIILRWLGAYIANDVKIASLQQILHFPPNLLNIECGVTTFGRVKLAPFQMTKEGLCYIDRIHIGSGSHLGNWCILMPGSRLSSKTLVGSLTLVTRETVCSNVNSIFLGIPAREMPFTLNENISAANVLPSSDSLSFHPFLLICYRFFITKCLLITLYSLLPMFVAPFIHTILYCAISHYAILSKKKRAQFTYSNVVTHRQQFFQALMIDFLIFLGPYLSATQYLVFLLRALGAHIGCDVILHDIHCVDDPHVTTIGNHVRFGMEAYAQGHTFEQRLLQLAPVTVNGSSVLMSNTLVLPGSTLHGHNRILPWTLVMKNDQLSPNTNWSGVPAQQIT